ncbi:unnamed protein product [Cyclocybe aegerita]|uniref:Hydrophobin n=1 Tax=Cyclocybe aegerita TaxID=1973307 RepID=A0A8S0W197_CYCAE|nr:unnamed protein product [Cyclocybe aegerita]
MPRDAYGGIISLEFLLHDFLDSTVRTLAIAAALAAATDPPNPPASQCNPPDLQCCESTGTAKNSAIVGLLAAVGVVLEDLDLLVGIKCTPISVIGVGGGSCTSQPFCCSNNSYNGLVALGCIPVNLNL